MKETYVEEHAGALRIAGTRISLDSVVYAFRDGQTPESIVQSFPLLTLEQVYGAITYYLANREAVDAYLEQGEADYEELRKRTREADPAFYQKLAEARRQGVAT